MTNLQSLHKPVDGFYVYKEGNSEGTCPHPLEMSLSGTFSSAGYLWWILYSFFVTVVFCSQMKVQDVRMTKSLKEQFYWTLPLKKKSSTQQILFVVLLCSLSIMFSIQNEIGFKGEQHSFLYCCTHPWMSDFLSYLERKWMWHKIVIHIVSLECIYFLAF